MPVSRVPSCTLCVLETNTTAIAAAGPWRRRIWPSCAGNSTDFFARFAVCAGSIVVRARTVALIALLAIVRKLLLPECRRPTQSTWPDPAPLDRLAAYLAGHPQGAGSASG